METDALRLDGVCKSFGGVQALTNVNLRVSKGEVLGVIGENGAGKSTLMKIIAGVMPPDKGTISLDGSVVHFGSPADAARHGVAMVYQDLALCDNLDAVSNLFLGAEIVGRRWPGARRRRGAMRRSTEELLERLGIKLRSLDLPVGQLSGGQRQAIAVSRAIMRDPKVVIFDEPTAALAVNQRDEVLRAIARLRSEGHAVLVVSHELVDVRSISDRIIVLRLGGVAAEFTAKEGYAEHELVAAIVGMSASAGAPNAKAGVELHGDNG